MADFISKLNKHKNTYPYCFITDRKLCVSKVNPNTFKELGDDWLKLSIENKNVRIVEDFNECSRNNLYKVLVDRLFLYQQCNLTKVVYEVMSLLAQMSYDERLASDINNELEELILE